MAAAEHADRVLAGSDYPYPLGERPAGGLARRAGFLDEVTRNKILFLNGLGFLGLADDSAWVGTA
jgi:aminocarboxymuconate-semialdehyde decarboxylase